MHRRWLDLSEFTTDLETIAQKIDNGLVKEIYKKEYQYLAIKKKD